MKLVFHKSFNKDFSILLPAQKTRVKTALKLFLKNPHHPSLRNHALNGKWASHRSISVGGDLRLHYIEISSNEVLFVALGTHSKLYK